MSKQDRQGARTVTDLERKYNLGNFGEQFAEVFGIATDARKATIELEEKLQSEITAVRNEIRKNNEGILLRSEFETYQETVTAELALKVGKGDNGQIISMINASADLIELTSNRLIVDSDFFKLTETGAATITSAQIDYAKIDHSEINYSFLKDADINVARIADAKIGSAYFDDDTNRTPQIQFLKDGIYLWGDGLENGTNRYCFVWENANGHRPFRMYGNNNGLHLEGVSYGNNTLDLNVFGISIRELYNKVNELSGHTHSYSETSTTATCTKAGVTTYTCDCGHYYTEEAPATGHSYSDGYCVVCGAADPNFAMELFVNHGSNGVTVSWNAVEGVVDYYVAVLTEDMDYVDSKYITTTSINMGAFSSIGTGTYKVKVRACGNGNTTLKEGITTVTVSSVG